MPDKSGGIPKSITLGGVEYVLADHPELMSLVQAGRKDEKDKLYSTITGLEASIKVLKDEQKKTGELSQKDKDELKKMQDELAVTKAELEKAKKDDPADPKGGKDPKEPKETKTGMTAEEVAKIVADALEKQNKAFEEKLGGVKGDLTKKTVEDYRKEVLEKNKGVIIDALVPEGLGSVEDVNKAVEKALETSKQYIRKDYKVGDKTENLTLAEIELKEKEIATPPAGTPPAGGTYVPAGTPPPPPSGGGDLTGKELVKNLGEMSQKDFEKNREAIRQEIRKVGYSEQS